MTKKIRILLVDDEKLIRQGMSVLLSTYHDIEVVGEASDGVQAIDFCQKNEVDLVLMDIRMPGMNGIDATHKIINLDNTVKVLMLTTFEDADYIKQAMAEGASGYLLKDQSYIQIYNGIKTAMAGNLVLDGKIGLKLVETNETNDSSEAIEEVLLEDLGLNSRELELIRMLASGLNNQEIAENTHLTVGTIKNNISKLLDKLELRDRTQLVIFAYKNNLV